MTDWAIREVEIACKKENPNWDGKSFHYGCSCYMSALKAYKSLADDGHSGYSWSFTKNILLRLMEGRPLTPITDEDFANSKGDNLPHDDGSISLQCPRMSSLFRYTYPDGSVKYHDLDRCVCYDVESPDSAFGSGIDKIVDELFPITMPYIPSNKPYKIFVRTFLTDRKNGDFDTQAVEYIITPEGEKIYPKVFKGEDYVTHKWSDLTEDEYNARMLRRVDPVREKVVEKITYEMTYDSDDTKERAIKAALKKVDEDVYIKWKDDLIELCRFYDIPGNEKYNTFDDCKALVTRNEEYANLIKEHPALEKVSDHIQIMMDEIKNNIK